MGARKFYAGKEFYVVDEGTRKAEVDKLRMVAAGLSGSTDMYFHIAKHLKMDITERRKFRLASFGQMLTNQDHSYHEIMHVARTQGEVRYRLRPHPELVLPRSDGLEAEVCVSNPDARPGVHNPPGTPSSRYHDPETPPPDRLRDSPLNP